MKTQAIKINGTTATSTRLIPDTAAELAALKNNPAVSFGESFAEARLRFSPEEYERRYGFPHPHKTEILRRRETEPNFMTAPLN